MKCNMIALFIITILITCDFAVLCCFKLIPFSMIRCFTMFDKFTNRAKQIIKFAKKEAQRLNHNYLSTEHILLGLLKLGQGIAVNVLRNLNVDYDTVLGEVEKMVGFGPEMQVYGDPALTGKVKKVFECANEEADILNHNYVGTEHLLLGLLRQTDGNTASA